MAAWPAGAGLYLVSKFPSYNSGLLYHFPPRKASHCETPTASSVPGPVRVFGGLHCHWGDGILGAAEGVPSTGVLAATMRSSTLGEKL